jgi:hypothetical protein
MISRSKEANQKNGILNPDSIYPGQVLNFLFEDGIAMALIVEPGDNQWKIVRDKLAFWQNLHGPIVDYVDPVPVKIPEAIEFHWYYDEWNLFGVLAVIFFLALLLKFISMWWKERNQDPISAGKPQVLGGVSNTGAYERMQQIVANRFPGTRMEIRNIRRGRLSGLAKIFYADGKSKKINLKSVSAYAGEITVDNQEETIYFLQACGNDARNGSYMMGNSLIFTPDALINKAGVEVPLPAVEDATMIEESEVNVPDPGSEFHQHIEKSMKILGDVLKSKEEKHKVTFKVTRDALEAEIQYKYDSTSKKGGGH